MNTATKFTMLRIFMIPLFMICMYLSKAHEWLYYVSLAVFILASLTDLLDGYIARKYHQVTDLGKFLDPLADKVLVLAAMCILCQWNKFPAWTLMLVLTREFAVSGLRMIASNKGRVIAAGWSGKVKTVVTMVALCFMIVLQAKLPMKLLGDTFIQVLSWFCIFAISVTTLYSGVEYFIQNKDTLR